MEEVVVTQYSPKGLHLYVEACSNVLPTKANLAQRKV